MIAAGAVLAALGLLAVAACGSGGTGARDEGPAHGSAVAGSVTSPSPSPSASERYRQVDAVALLRSDPEVSTAVKAQLKPCDGDNYKVDVKYGDLTGAAVDDVVINVVTCADWVGIASYVYRDEDGRFKNVFKSEDSPVYSEIDQGTLSVFRQYYEEGDPISSPSGDVLTPYTWKAGRFVAGKPIRNEYRNASDEGAQTAPDE